MNHNKSQKQFKKKRLKIQVTYVGGWYTARYEGRAEKFFGETSEEATKRLTNGK